MVEYINLKYKPTKNDLLCEYYVEPAKGVSFNEACENLACESSIGTWTTISTLSPKLAKKLKPHVYYINKKTGIIKVAYHSELFEAGNMPGILSSIAGNIFGMKIVKNLRLLDISFPKSIIKGFHGPQYGIKGIRKLTKTKNRPLTGTIVKPKVGLTAQQHAKVAYEAWMGGLDIVKDDENLVSMKFNDFYKRIKLTLKMRDKAEKETGEKKIYLANVTAESLEMIKRADHIRKCGGEYIMIDILTAGWAGVQTISDYARKHNMAVHAHRAMHGALTRNQKHGIAMNVLAKCARLIGVDTLHIGTAAVGKMHGSKDEELKIEREIESQYTLENDKLHVLDQKWYHIKPCLAVASGGLSPLSMPKLVKIMGVDIVAQAGGGVHGNPGGTRAGGAGFRQATEAAVKGIPLKKYAKTHKELQWALDKWG